MILLRCFFAYVRSHTPAPWLLRYYYAMPRHMLFCLIAFICCWLLLLLLRRFIIFIITLIIDMPMMIRDAIIMPLPLSAAFRHAIISFTLFSRFHYADDSCHLRHCHTCCHILRLPHTLLMRHYIRCYYYYAITLIRHTSSFLRAALWYGRQLSILLLIRHLIILRCHAAHSWRRPCHIHGMPCWATPYATITTMSHLTAIISTIPLLLHTQPRPHRHIRLTPCHTPLICCKAIRWYYITCCYAMVYAMLILRYIAIRHYWYAIFRHGHLHYAIIFIDAADYAKYYTYVITPLLWWYCYAMPERCRFIFITQLYRRHMIYASAGFSRQRYCAIIRRYASHVAIIVRQILLYAIIIGIY